METVKGLMCSRRYLDPHLGARGNCRIVGLGAGTVVPVRLRQAFFHDDWRRLYDNLRRIVVRVIPPRTPPEYRAGNDDAVTMKVAVESRVAVKSGRPVEAVAARAPASTTAREARRGRSQKNCNR